MINLKKSKNIIPMDECFFCDGHWYVLTSSSLGGADITPENLVETICSTKNDIKLLLEKGICLPLFFDADCCLDQAIFVIGDLNEKAEEEWIGKLTWKLNIPCGKLILLCGGAECDWLKYAISEQPPDKNFQYFQRINVEPGEYLVTIYAYMSSYTAYEYFYNRYNFGYGGEDEYEFFQRWFEKTRPGMDLPLWIEELDGDLSDRLVSYIIQLKPLENEPLFPNIDPDIGWCSKFEFREPQLCPLGLPFETLI